MEHWVDERAAQLKTEKEDYAKRHAQGTLAVDNLESIVRRDVERWNKLNPGYRRRIESVTKTMSSGGFQVRKTSYPSATVEVMVDPASLAIKTTTVRVRSTDNEPRVSNGRFELAQDTKGARFITPSGDRMSMEEASRFLLLPVIEVIG